MPDYLFVDGGYLRQRFKACIRSCYDTDVALWPHGMKIALGTDRYSPRNSIQKVFWYDCLPDPGTTHDGEREKFMETIRSMPGWHVREGRLAGTRKEKRSQKRVDVLLTVEMLSHATVKNMDRAILIAGDDDFTPLVAELLRHGTYVEVWTDRSSESPYLSHSADEGKQMDLPFYWALASPQFQNLNPLPSIAQNHLPRGGSVLRHGIS